MKNLRTILVCLSVIITGTCVKAQSSTDGIPLNEPNPNKPKLFASLPDNIPVSTDQFAAIMTLEPGTPVNFTIGSALRLQGQVVSTANKYNNTIQSVVVRSTNYDGALLTVSRVVNTQDNSVRFTGRIISNAYGDLYELQNKNGAYSFVKRGFYELVNE